MKKRRYTLIAIVVIILSIAIYYLIEASKFANGVKDDIIKRDSFLNENGIRLDSMGTVKYEDYQKIKDSLDHKK